MALWPAKSQGVLFGGVSDVDKDEEQLDSVFYADMYIAPFLLQAEDSNVLLIGMHTRLRGTADG